MPDTIVPITITDLVLEALPARLPRQPFGMKLALMRADPVPLHFYRYLYGTVGRDWLWVNRSRLSDDDLSAIIHKPGIEIFVLYGDGAPAGFYELDFSDQPVVELAFFGLMPEWTGRRIGAWLLGTAIDLAFSRDAKTITVKTCTRDHPRALPLYQRTGFVPIRQRPDKLVVPDGFPLPADIK